MERTPRLVQTQYPAAIAQQVARAVRAHPSVGEIQLTGTWPRGAAVGPYGWDFSVTTADFGGLAADLPALVAGFDPLAAQWDRLGDLERFKLVLSGPIKIDLLFPDMPHAWDPPWRAGPDTLAAMDAHFWDWALWLVGKCHEGKGDRVLGELLTLTRHLLEPMGVPVFPTDLELAADGYVRARDRLELRYGIRVPRRLEAEIRPLLHTPRDTRYRPYGLTS